ncbi:hypothetical protein ED312_00790 [Sinomicrobium pectinilyticum]|uniref:Uncharacterized protein n=1 Tax=Sinomicrobium pectinilyticum TaxID=1084421 RepID=A0A3N0F593_SINP1|nr:hypothetical protein ED312_00790 [Sinomicrobium pectinilyticum]
MFILRLLKSSSLEIKACAEPAEVEVILISIGIGGFESSSGLAADVVSYRRLQVFPLKLQTKQKMSDYQ